ncbi:MAG: hypothetical protein J1F13_02100 [Prevotellaceae bacterium]|nr:hypothetical protein [Prevotellaceae bacterium]
MKKILSSVLLLIGALTASITAQNTASSGGVLKAIKDASEKATYTLTTSSKGSLFYNGTTLIAQQKQDSDDKGYQFAFLSPGHDDNYYMYSLGAKKFVTYDEGYKLTFSDDPDKIYPVILKPSGSNWETTKPDNGEDYVFVNFSGISRNLLVTNTQDATKTYYTTELGTWTGTDWGSVYLIEEANANCEELDEALRILNSSCAVTYALYDGDATGEPIVTEVQLQKKNSEIQIPASFNASDWYEYTIEGTIGNATTATITVIRTIKSNILKSVSDLSNDKAYQIVVPRGTFTTNNGYVANTVKNNNNYEVSNFAIIESNGSYYLWSIKDNKFVSSKSEANVAGVLTSTLAEVTFVEGESRSNADLKLHPNMPFVRIKIDGSTLIASGGGAYGVVFAGDNAAFDGGAACVIIEAGDFSFPVKVTDTEWATFSSPLPITKPSEVTAYTATMASEDKLELQEIEGDVIPANTGVLLKAAEGSYNFSFPATSSVSAEEGNVLQPSVGETTVTPYETYVLANGKNGLGFYLLNAEAVPAFKAYINKTDANKAAAYLSFGNSVTGLVGVESSAAEADVYYDVQGRKVVAPQKGQLYIVNGKKVLY